jgi:hypothetical protein
MAWLRANWPGLALAVVVLGAVAAASSGVVGLAWDDGVYVAAGQALAHGKGYLLANRIGDQTVPLYPAGYPLLVALVWLAAGTPSAVFAVLAVVSALCVSVAAFRRERQRLQRFRGVTGRGYHYRGIGHTPGAPMPVTARLSKAFYERLGEEVTNELVE